MENAGLEFKGPVKKKRLENEGTENEGPSVRGGKRGNWKMQDIHKEYMVSGILMYSLLCYATYYYMCTVLL